MTVFFLYSPRCRPASPPSFLPSLSRRRPIADRSDRSRRQQNLPRGSIHHSLALGKGHQVARGKRIPVL